MKKNKKIIILSLAILALIIFAAYPDSGSAQQTVGQQVPPTSSNGGIVPCGGPTDPCTLCHFIVGFHNLVQLGLYWILTFALVGIFIAGVIYVVSTGNEGMITKAKGFMTACLIGFAVVAGAWMIVNTALTILSAKGDLGVGATNWYTFNCN